MHVSWSLGRWWRPPQRHISKKEPGGIVIIVELKGNNTTEGERKPRKDCPSVLSFLLLVWEETGVVFFDSYYFINGPSCSYIRLIITLRCHKPAVDNFVIYFD